MIGGAPASGIAFDAALQLVALWQYGSGLLTWNSGTWANRPGNPQPYLEQSGKMGYDVDRKHVVLLGTNEAGAVETWTWDGKTWALASTGANGFTLQDDAALVYDSARGALLYITPTGDKTSSHLQIMDWTGNEWIEANTGQ